LHSAGVTETTKQDAARNAAPATMTPSRRITDELECVASILLAIVLAHAFDAEMIAWAAFSAFVLMKGPVAETLLRSSLRMIGTLLGASLAIWFTRLTSGALWEVMLVAILIGGLGLYGALTARHAYAWLLFGLTFVMIVLDKLEDPQIVIEALALTRVIEVGAGTLAALIVSIAATLTARRWWPALPTPAAPTVRWHPEAARHALLAGLAVALLPLIHRFVELRELAQAGVTILAVMIVPAARLNSGGIGQVRRRLQQRALGCICGGLLATGILLLAQGSVPILVVGTCLGVMIGRHIENGSAANAYLGLQFTLAILVVLVPDDYASADIGPGLERLVSIFVGMAVLAPVLVLTHFASPRRTSVEAADEGPASE
jgi:uncharacterized membrane protein YccC